MLKKHVPVLRNPHIPHGNWHLWQVFQAAQLLHKACHGGTGRPSGNDPRCQRFRGQLAILNFGRVGAWEWLVGYIVIR